MRLLTAVTIVTLALTVARAHAAPYSPVSGFHPRTATITIAPELAEGAAYWNAIAGRSMFAVATDPAITLDDSTGICGACAAPVGYRPDGTHGFTLTDAYDECEIYARPDEAANVIAHELGHCLGFDHTRRGIMGLAARPRRSVDRKLLTTAGYI